MSPLPRHFKTRPSPLPRVLAGLAALDHWIKSVLGVRIGRLLRGEAWPWIWLLSAHLSLAAESATVSSAERQASRNVFGYDPTPDFIAYDPLYRAKHDRCVRELERLQRELARQTAGGRATPCARQLFLEARWLTFYSAHWDRIDRRLRDLQTMLQQAADPPDSREQIESDGSYDHCSEAWFLKLDSTIEELEDRADRGERARYPLKLLDQINAPEKLRQYLDSLLISDVRKTGLDNRFELNIAITAIERFIVGHVPHDYVFHPQLKQALFDYQDVHWQDTNTGYFGGWYRMPDGSVRKTADLSVTFHIASYRRDNLKRIPEMLRTTLAFKDLEYPFGWLEEGQRSNHHNYDVVRPLRIGWPFLEERDKKAARVELRRMIEFCLQETLNPDGSFKLMDEDTVGSSFLFPVSVLNELGYFRRSRRFWTSESFPDALSLADKIENRILAMGLTDTESRKVLRRFQEARQERAVWRAAGAVLAGLVLSIGWKLWQVRRRSIRKRT